MKYTIFIISVLCLNAAPVDGQWKQLPGPYGSYGLNSFFREGDTIYVSTYYNSIYKSGDEGHTWSLMPVNLFQISINGGYFNYENFLYKKDSLVFIKTSAYEEEDQLFVSSDYGNTYSMLLDSGYDYSIAELNNYLYITRVPYGQGSDGRTLIRSNDGGKTWQDLSPKSKSSIPDEFIQLQSFDGNLYAIRSYTEFNNDWQLCRSKDGGFTWDTLLKKASKDWQTLPQIQFYTFFYGKKDTNLWLAVDTTLNNRVERIQNLYKLSLSGDSVEVSKFPADHILDTTVTSMLFDNNILSASTRNNIYVYYPSSDSWQNITDKLQHTGISGLYFPASKKSNEYLIYSYVPDDIFRFSPHSNYYVVSDTGITNSYVYQIFSYRDTLYAIDDAAYGGILFSSTNHGDSWLSAPLQFLSENIGSTPKGLLYAFGDTLFLKTDDGIFRSVLESSIGGFTRMENSYFCYAVDSALRYFRSDDSGVTWTKLSKVPTQYAGVASAIIGNLFFVGAYDGLHVSKDSCKTWNALKGLPSATCGAFNSYDTILYAEGDLHKIPVYQLFKSIDSGITWIPIGPRRNQTINIIYPLKNIILLGGDSGIYRCNPDGSNFTYIHTGMTLQYCSAIESDSEYLYFGTNNRGIFRAKLDEVLNYVNGVSKPIIFDNVSSNLYPNPSDGFITISASEPITKISIFDEKGVEINLPEEKFRIGERNVKIDIQSLRPGAYICRLATSSGMSSQKFIKD